MLKGSQYHLSPIEEATRKFDLSATILYGNHKSSQANLNAEALEKATVKEVEDGWALPLTIDLVFHTNNVGVILLGIS